MRCSLCNNLEHIVWHSSSLLVRRQWSSWEKIVVQRYAVSFLWFLLLIGTGIANITTHPGIFRAFDPSRAVMRKLPMFLQHHRVAKAAPKVFVRTRDYDLLAGVLLAVTGCEAMFAKFVLTILSHRLKYADLLLVSGSLTRHRSGSVLSLCLSA